MTEEKLKTLDTLEVAFYAIEQPMRAAAVEVQGGKIVPVRVWYNDFQRLCISLEIEPKRAPHEQFITACQINQYFKNEERKKRCDFMCGRTASDEIYTLYGAAVQAIMRRLYNKTEAVKWAAKWEAGREKALSIYDVAASDKTNGYIIAVFSALSDLGGLPKERLEEFADIEQIEAETARVVREILQPKETAGEQQAGGLHEFSKAGREALAPYLASTYKGTLQLEEDVKQIEKYLQQKRGKKAACRVLKEIFNNPEKLAPIYKTERAVGGRLTWERWCGLWSEAFGVSLDYRETLL